LTGKVYIRPQPGDYASADQWPVQGLFTNSQDQTGKVKEGTFSQLKADMLGAELVLILPAEQVLLLSVQLPGKNVTRLKQALPYALEDQLISDIDEQFFVMGPKLDEKRYAVAVINKAYLENILDSLKQIGIYPNKVLPESLLLPLHEGEITAVEDGERIIVRTGRYSGFACDATNLDVMLSNVTNETNEKINKIVFYGTINNLPDKFEDIQCEQHDLPHKLMSLLYHDSVAGIDLLPGHYIHREKMDKKLKQWLPAAAMVLIWAAVQLSIQVFDYARLKKQDIVLQQSLEKIYRQTFPDARKIVNVEAQMRQRLDDLRKRRGKSESGFTEMLVRSAPVLQRTPGLKLHALRYNDGRMDLELEVRDLNSLEQLKENLIKTGNWQVEIQSASSVENKVQGKLQLRSSES